MRLQDWWDGLNWQAMPPSKWIGKPSPLNWDNLGDWGNMPPDDWGIAPRAELSPRYPPVSLSSLGFSQDDDYLYLPLDSLPSVLTWGNMTIEQWNNLPDWNFAPLDANQLFTQLILKLQSASLPVHTVRRSSNFFVIESSSRVLDSDFEPNNY